MQGKPAWPDLCYTKKKSSLSIRFKTFVIASVESFNTYNDFQNFKMPVPLRNLTLFLKCFSITLYPISYRKAHLLSIKASVVSMLREAVIGSLEAGVNPP